MKAKEIIDILKNKKTPKITVFGDFCLDQYLRVDAKKDELSLETNLVAYQISQRKVFAGAGGTITNNLRALGAEVDCIGIVGEDGTGYELIKALNNAGADTSLMVRTKERYTGSYIKPMRYEDGQETEMNRFDIKNFSPTPRDIENKLIENLKKVVDINDAIIICDQYNEIDTAAVTSYVRQQLSELAQEYADKIWYVDSRSNIHEFRNIIIKCNHIEIAKIFKVNHLTVDADAALKYAKKLYDNNKKPVYVTLGEDGCIVYDGDNYKVPAFRVEGDIDIVGAGDASSAGIVFALTKGASYEQAALVGNAASSIVIQQIGETGVAPLEDVIETVASTL